MGRKKPSPEGFLWPLAEKSEKAFRRSGSELCFRHAERGLAVWPDGVWRPREKYEHVCREYWKGGCLDQEGILEPNWRGKLRRLAFVLKDDSQSVPWPAALVSPGCWLEMKIPQPSPDPLKQNLQRWGPAVCGLTNPLGESNAHWSLRTSTVGVYSAAYVQTGKFNSFPQTSGLKKNFFLSSELL